MTPDCCTQAWAKTTGHKIIQHLPDATKYCVPGAERCERSAPAPTSAEWLAEIVEAAGFYGLWWQSSNQVVAHFTVESYPARGLGPDLRRALCAALNGKPCERVQP